MTEYSSESPVTSVNETVDSRYGQTKDGTSDDNPSFVSMMRMRSQETTPDVLEYERSIIRDELHLPDSDEIIFDDEGWSSRVYMIDGGATVYKFPRSPDVKQDYAREIAAIRMLEGGGRDIVTQRFIGLDPGNRYFSYRGIVGTQLSELLRLLETGEKARIGSAVGSFLKELHGMDLGEVPVMTIYDEIEEYQSKYRLALPVIDNNFSANEQSEIERFFLDFMPNEIERLGSEIRLCHGDLGSYNIVIGNDGAVGIIDFGNVGYYDQSKDFIDFGDETVFLAALEAYGGDMLLRAKAIIRTVALTAIDLVYYESKKDTRGVEITVNKLRQSLQDIPEYFNGRPS